MAQILDTVLLFSLPASGKSETRTYMASLTPEQCVTDMAMGPTAQLDDYPYVHFMHRIDDELLALGQSYRFYHGPNRPFQDDWTWAMLIELLNEDYDDLIHGRQHHVASAAQLLFDRMDAARIKAQMRPVLDELPWKVRMKLAKALEAECRENYPWSAASLYKRIICEAASPHEMFAYSSRAPCFSACCTSCDWAISTIWLASKSTSQ